MKTEEAITYAIMSDGHGKTTDQIADAINRHGWHQHKDGKPLPLQHQSIITLSSPYHHLIRTFEKYAKNLVAAELKRRCSADKRSNL